MIKKILTFLGGLLLLAVIILAILVFVAPVDYRVERSVTINKPKADVMNYAKSLKNQNEQWGPWAKKDPNIKITYKGTDGDVGSISSWVSDKDDVGVGEQEIMKITDNEIDNDLRFTKPFEATDHGYMKFDAISPTQTKIVWGFYGTMNRPMNIFLLLFDMDKEVGKDFDAGLNSLKTILEKQ